MAAKVRIRIRGEKDLSTLGAALVEVHTNDGYPVEGVADPKAWLSFPGLVRSWVAELDGEIVGQVSICRARREDAVRIWTERSGTAPDRVAVLARLFVRPGARGRAVGERLTRAAMHHACESGITLVLDVMVKDQAAVRLYERLGWEHIGTTTHVFDGSEGVPARCYVWDS